MLLKLPVRPLYGCIAQVSATDMYQLEKLVVFCLHTCSAGLPDLDSLRSIAGRDGRLHPFSHHLFDMQAETDCFTSTIVENED
jgi:hypothetical protein